MWSWLCRLAVPPGCAACLCRLPVPPACAACLSHPYPTSRPPPQAIDESSGVPPVMREGAIHGWLFKRGGLKSKAYKKRYAVYEPRTRRFTYYENDLAASRDQACTPCLPPTLD